MTSVSTKPGASPEVTAIDTQARGPLLLLIGSGLVWLLASGVLSLIAALQLHTPGFLADCPFFTYGHTQAMAETAFLYGWAANAGLAVALWVLGRLGGYPLRALNWVLIGALFWNLGVTVGLVGIAVGDMTSFSLLQLPRYVQPLLVFAWASMAISGVLAWAGRRTDGTYVSQWYAVGALFLFPWMLIAAQAVLLWMPVRGVAQAVAAAWYAQGTWSMWIAPLALAGAYYIVPKVSGRALPNYDFAPLSFWTLAFVGVWTCGRHLIGGPVPAWVPTMAIVSSVLMLFHYLVVALNFRIAFSATGNAMRFVRFGVMAYLLNGLLETIIGFRAVAVETQFTFVVNAVQQVGLYGAASMMLFGGIYYMVPRLTGTPWASAGLTAGHRVLVMVGIVGTVVTLFVGGLSQGSDLLDPKLPVAQIFGNLRLSLMMNVVAQIVLLAANLLLLVNFCRTACACCKPVPDRSQNIFRQPATLEAHVS